MTSSRLCQIIVLRFLPVKVKKILLYCQKLKKAFDGKEKLIIAYNGTRSEMENGDYKRFNNSHTFVLF